MSTQHHSNPQLHPQLLGLYHIPIRPIQLLLLQPGILCRCLAPMSSSTHRGRLLVYGHGSTQTEAIMVQVRRPPTQLYTLTSYPHGGLPQPIQCNMGYRTNTKPPRSTRGSAYTLALSSPSSFRSNSSPAVASRCVYQFASAM